jgi:hypothetical protein
MVQNGNNHAIQCHQGGAHLTSSISNSNICILLTSDQRTIDVPKILPLPLAAVEQCSDWDKRGDLGIPEGPFCFPIFSSTA